MLNRFGIRCDFLDGESHRDFLRSGSLAIAREGGPCQRLGCYTWLLHKTPGCSTSAAPDEIVSGPFGIEAE